MAYTDIHVVISGGNPIARISDPLEEEAQSVVSHPVSSGLFNLGFLEEQPSMFLTAKLTLPPQERKSKISSCEDTENEKLFSVYNVLQERGGLG